MTFELIVGKDTTSTHYTLIEFNSTIGICYFMTPLLQVLQTHHVALTCMFSFARMQHNTVRMNLGCNILKFIPLSYGYGYACIVTS